MHSTLISTTKVYIMEECVFLVIKYIETKSYVTVQKSSWSSSYVVIGRNHSEALLNI